MKSIPMPVWIGLGLAILVILWMSSRQSAKATSGPVTDATVGNPNVQPGAGTDQMLGNLSQMFQTGFKQIIEQDKENAQSIRDAITGLGTTYQQIGGGVQGSMNGTASGSAVAHSGGQPVASHSQAQADNPPPTTSLFNVPITGPDGGAGFIQVVANNAAAARENAYQGGNTPTGDPTPA